MRLPVNHALPLAALIALTGCGGGGAKPAVTPPPANGPAADYPMVIGDPFTIEGETWRPADTLNYDMVGYASPGEEGAGTVSAAHKTLPLPSYVEVTSLESGKTILVRVERRGPMRNDRLIELSPGAAAQLGVTGRERAAVRVRRVNPPEQERALLRSGQTAPDRMDTPRPLLAVLMRKLDPQTAPPPATPPQIAPSPEPSPPEPSSATTPVEPPVPVAKPKPAPKPKPVPSAVTPMPPPAATPAPSASAANGSLVVQVAAFSTKERADAAAAKLGAGVSSAGRLWRMRMGPFATRAQAEAALAKAKRAGYSDARIQRAD